MATTFEKAPLIDPTTARGIVQLAWRLHWILPNLRWASLFLTAAAGALLGAIADVVRIETETQTLEWLFEIGTNILLVPALLIPLFGGPTLREFQGDSKRVIALLPVSQRAMGLALWFQHFVLQAALTVPLIAITACIFNWSAEFAFWLPVKLLLWSVVIGLVQASPELTRNAFHTFQTPFGRGLAAWVSEIAFVTCAIIVLLLPHGALTIGLLGCIAIAWLGLRMPVGYARKHERVWQSRPSPVAFGRKDLETWATFLLPGGLSLLICLGVATFILVLGSTESKPGHAILVSGMFAVYALQWPTVARGLRALPLSSTQLACAVFTQSLMVATPPALLVPLFAPPSMDYLDVAAAALLASGLAACAWQLSSTLYWIRSQPGGLLFVIFCMFGVNMAMESLKVRGIDFVHTAWLMFLCAAFLWVSTLSLAVEFRKTTLSDVREYHRNDALGEADGPSAPSPEGTLSAYIYMFAAILFFIAIAIALVSRIPLR